jgi:hypothetical protein
MPDAVEPLIDVREDETFLADKAMIENALAHASRFAKGGGFASRAEAGEAADAIKALNNARKDADAHKKDITAQWRESTKHVNTEYKELLSPADAAEEALKQESIRFKRAEDAKVREEERARAEAEAEKQHKAEAAAQDAQDAAELAREDSSPEVQQLAADAHRDAAAAAIATYSPEPVVHAAPKQLRGDFGALGTRLVYKHTVLDPALVPDEYKSVDRTAIKARIDAEAKVAKATKRDLDLEIPGIRIFSEEVAISR